MSANYNNEAKIYQVTKNKLATIYVPKTIQDMYQKQFKICIEDNLRYISNTIQDIYTENNSRYVLKTIQDMYRKQFKICTKNNSRYSNVQ